MCAYDKISIILTLRFWIHGVIISLIAIIGLIGNATNLIILTQSNLKRKLFFKLLMTLACFETAYLLSWAPFLASHGLLYGWNYKPYLIYVTPFIRFAHVDVGSTSTATKKKTTEV